MHLDMPRDLRLVIYSSSRPTAKRGSVWAVTLRRRLQRPRGNTAVAGVGVDCTLAVADTLLTTPAQHRQSRSATGLMRFPPSMYSAMGATTHVWSPSFLHQHTFRFERSDTGSLIASHLFPAPRVLISRNASKGEPPLKQCCRSRRPSSNVSWQALQSFRPFSVARSRY